MAQIFNIGEQPRDMREGLGGASHFDRYGNRMAAIAWMTPLIVAANVVVFVAMAITFRSVLGFTPIQLAVWGGNSGMLDIQGQWWRLLTYQFLHANVTHIALNMWVMWTVGRFTERLYGSVTLLLLYLSAGIFAGLASVAWNPSLVSVGASGSIFGVLGALLALFVRSRDEVPVSLLRYWLPAVLFVIFNLVNGALEPGVDNAAHVGGVLAGFVFGAIVVRPIESRSGFPIVRFLVVGLIGALCAIPPLLYLGAFDRHPSTFEQFVSSHPWYVEHETPNLMQWQNLGVRMSTGTISNADVATTFERDILPFWKEANSQLQTELRRPGAKNPFIPLVADLARLRVAWAQDIILATRDADPQAATRALDDANKSIAVQARLDRLKLLSTADSLPPSMADSTIVVWFKDRIPRLEWRCVEQPAALGKTVSTTDDPNDGPMQRDQAACLAQHSFMRGDFAVLDALLRSNSRELSDLRDGTSRLQGAWDGLGDLFAYGNISLEDALRRTSEWRRTIPGSSKPGLAEVEIFRAWARAARGSGYASTVSPQAWAIYNERTAMAAEGLRDVAASAANDPFWYQLSIGLGRDQTLPIEKQRALFDAGAAKFPTYLPLYRSMLAGLMPRWSGSDVLVDRFILQMAERSADKKLDMATYARLYLIYGNLEGNDFNLVKDSYADRTFMKQGLALLRARYPGSDYVLNEAARFACIANDADEYRVLRLLLKNHLSATAWPDKLTVESCDRLSS